MIDDRDQEVLRFVFGDASRGETAERRARSSKTYFVRSQVQLALATPNAKGHILAAPEALSVFGFDALFRVMRDGSFPLVQDHREPATTLRAQREQLNLPVDQIAKAAGVARQAVESAETEGTRSSIRDLEKIAQALSLDERLLGYRPDETGAAIGVRLRELSDSDSAHFTPSSVLQLSEAAWVIARQVSLLDELGYGDFSLAAEYNISSDADYSRPTHKVGYRLAGRTRQLLGLGHTASIDSLRLLIEETLRIPLIQQQLDERFAGATLANGPRRGIVVNERGHNRNVWVRRMTLAHELGHLLWDPDQRLNRLVVDDYDAIDGTPSSLGDPVESRANAFAVAFLAPPDAVRELASTFNDRIGMLAELMNRFGISATAAKRHATNVMKRNFMDVPNKALPAPSADWTARENMAIDYFPIENTPISRRGRFALLVSIALRAGMISADTAAFYLRADRSQVSDASARIVDLLG